MLSSYLGDCTLEDEDFDGTFSPKYQAYLRKKIEAGEKIIREKIDSISVSKLEQVLKKTESEKTAWDKDFPCYIFMDTPKINMLKSVIDLKKKLLSNNNSDSKPIIEEYIKNNQSYMDDISFLDNYLKD